MGYQLRESFRESIQGARGRAMRAASIPERNLKPWSQVRELLRSSHWHSQVPERKPTSSKSMSMMVLIPKIDVGEGLDPQNRCRQAFEFPKSMSGRVWTIKIDVGDGLNFQNRWRRGLLIFQTPKINVPDDIWYIDFGYVWPSLIWAKVTPESERYLYLRHWLWLVGST